MKSAFLALCLLATAMIFMACGGESNDTTTKETVQAEHPDHPEHSTSTVNDGLALNNGNKWQMDDHTRDSFAKMAGSFENVDAAALDTASLKEAGSALRKDLDGLIQGCTMTGPDHDQLHVYLMAYIPAVTALQESGQLEDAKKVQHYLAIYDDYFE